MDDVDSFRLSPQKITSMYKLFFIVLLFSTACSETRKQDAFYMPAEWEPHEAIWFGWEDDNTSFYPVISTVIKGLLPTVHVKIAVRNDSLLTTCKNYLQMHGIDTAAISFYQMDDERYWIRDHGAAFLVNEKGELGVADFEWSLYGIEGWYNKYYYNNKDSVDLAVKAYLRNTGKVDSLMAVATNAKIIKSDIVIEGGAIEVNGKGTLILCEAVAFQRNPGKTKQQLEEGFKQALGVSKIIWMKQGLIEDAHIQQLHFSKYSTMGTGGHTDEFVRFVDPSTILLAWVEEDEINEHPFNQVNRERMAENLQILASSTDQDGKPFKIIKVPLPRPVERKVLVKQNISDDELSTDVMPFYFLPGQRPKVGDTLINVAASSYLNYLVSNGVVILPTYIHHGTTVEKEEKVKEIFRSVYPDRKQVFVDCMPQNWNGGGIHCSTQQEPKRK
jgi:agmatine deiminase